MGYFKRKRTNKKKGKRGTKRYRGGGVDTELNNSLTAAKAEVDLKSTSLQNLINTGTAAVQELIDAAQALLDATTAYEEIVKIALADLSKPQANRSPANGPR